MKLTNKNRLSITHPELCKEWDYEKNGNIRPEDVSNGSKKRIWWKCRACEEKWNTAICVRKNTGCPYCAGKLVSDKNRFSLLFPKLAREWHPTKNGKLKSCDVSYGSNKKVWWKCRKCKNIWLQSIKSRVGDGHRCLVCNSLAAKCPEMISEWHLVKNKKLKPSDIFFQSHRKLWWKCSKCNFEWQATANSRNSNDCGCPSCSGAIVSDKNRFSLLFPELIKEWHPTKNGKLKSCDVSYGSRKKIWWECSKCNHKWIAAVFQRSRGCGCPSCSGLIVSDKNRFSSKFPWLAKEWHPTKNGKLKPDDVSYGSNKKIWWKCKNNHAFKMEVVKRSNGYGCPQCNKIDLKDGFCCDSLPEAYVYLKLKTMGFTIEHHKRYGFGKHKYDFYLPEIKTYIEVTSFGNRDNCGGGRFGKTFWKKYNRKINRKRKYVEQILGAKFRFMQIEMLPFRLRYVRKNMK